MSLSAAVIDALIASGATREQLAAAMKADIAEREAGEIARLNTKRAGNRERQQRKRSRDNAQSRDVTHVTRDERDPPPNEVNNLTPTLKNSEPKGSSQKTNRGSRLPDDWAPTPDDLEFARSLGHSDERITSIAESFADHWRAQPGQRGVKLDWPATWRNWMRREGKVRDQAAKYVSSSGYEYRGDEEAVMREAQRRGDNDTYWKAAANRSRGSQSAGAVVDRIRSSAHG